MRKAKVLYVEDEVGESRMLKENLEAIGDYEVAVENWPPNALTTAQQFKPDLILLDVLMPTMDGGDVAAQIRRDQTLREVPIVFLTATVAHAEAGTEGLQSGGNLFVSKPASVEVLDRCIRAHVPEDLREDKEVLMDNMMGDRH